MSIDLKDTVHLPQTEFPMRAGLPKKEPQILGHWREIDLYARQRELSKGREKFILHDGPPYANGNLHIGHALNKILKDVINRAQQMLGRDANYVPGWDCHGLPIEWKVEERYRDQGRDKDEVEINEFRRECREFAAHWIDVQSEEFQRLGVIGDWRAPYTTMAFAAEAQIAAELMKFAASGQLYRGSKPVLWSVVEKTALAEAEVEYHDHVSPTVWVKFPVVEITTPELENAAIVIWTTTPWTIPANRAICFSETIAYALYRVTAAPDDNWVKTGDTLIVAKPLVDDVMANARVTGFEELRTVAGDELARLVCAHPLRGVAGGAGYWDYDVPLLPADYVTDEQGTGFVHTAPGHGADDYNTFVNNRQTFAGLGLTEVPHTIDETGAYYQHVPLLAGQRIFDDKGKEAGANAAVIELLVAAGMLVARGRLTHTYPHSWRSKAPLIFRNTAQWFIAMGDERGPEGLRAKALKAIGETRFVPPAGRARLQGMIEQRPDWVISRQRAWGVPITAFVRKADGAPLVDDQVNTRIVEAFRTEGADAWFADGAAARFLGNAYDPADYEQVRDILDVWFDSGSTHSFVLEQRPDLKWPASLYLEGSDQHRGWFHSSLLESCGTRGRAPYEAVLTHGFVMAEDGRKMSKSLGNVVAPQDIVAQYGADILRLWVVGSDYSEDLRIGPEIIKYQADLYRRIRNTLRFLLGNLATFEAAHRVAAAEMPELERLMLHRVWELDRLVRRAIDDYDFHNMWTSLHHFCAVELSAFYFDIRKDSLYCDALDDPRRRACLTVLDILFDHLTAWLAPILCFTAEEAWLIRARERRSPNAPETGVAESVHLRVFPEADEHWRDDALAARWQTVRRLRRVITGALEEERAAKRIGSSLEADPTLWAPAEDLAALNGVDMAEVAITSSIRLASDDVPADAFTLDEVPGAGVRVARADGRKCVRCYQIKPEVTALAPGDGGQELCERCRSAVVGLG